MKSAIAHSPGPWVFVGDPELGRRFKVLLDQAPVEWHSHRPEQVRDWDESSDWGTTLILDARDPEQPWLGRVLSIVSRVAQVAVVAIGDPHLGFAESLPESQMNQWSVVQLCRLAGQARHQQIAGNSLDRDPLTGCARRSVIQRQLGQMLSQSLSREQPMAYVLVDLSGLKEINARRGEQAGDRVLQSIAHGLRSTVRMRDTVARVDGTTFAILCRQIRGSMRVFSVIEKIQDALKQALVETKSQDLVSFSIGVAVCPDGDLQISEVARSAELAMVRAKRQGANACRFFTSAMGVQRRRQLNMQARLSWAIRQEHFSLSFRPQWFFGAGRVKSIEARVHWVDPELGLQDYDDWMQVAIESGLLSPIRHWATRQLCELIAQVDDEALRFSIDLSIHQLLSENFEATTLSILNEAGVAPERLCFELQEGELQPQAIRLITRLSDLGFVWMLDHLGAGGVDFKQLEEWPLMGVKLSAERVAQVGQSERMLKGLIGLCQSLGLGIGADGVNTAEQLHRLDQLGVNFVQGQAVAEPMSQQALLEWLPAQVLTKQPM